MPSCASNLTQLLESDLASAGFKADFIGPLQPVSLAYQAALASLSKSLLSKYTYDDEEKDEARNAKALDLFLECNSLCSRWVEVPVRNTTLEEVLGETKASLDSFFHPQGGRGILLTFNSIRENLDVGKGANIGCTNVDFYSKVFCSTLTSSSSDLIDLYRLAVSDLPIWALAEKRREAKMGDRVVPGSSLTFVPKKETISRTICTEPLANMLFQKGIEAVLTKRLRQVFGIDLSRQPGLNSQLARDGSLGGRFATIDLKSASDLNSIQMMKTFLPPAAYRWLERTRSPSTVLPNGQVIELHMVSSMGNAFTFPLQTLLFASVVCSCYKVLGIKIQRPSDLSPGNFGVFGDDIVVVSEAFDLVCDALRYLGHQVNADKSFNTGQFRESCGTDWFAGRDIRGVYIKRLDDVCDFYSAINRLNVWSAKHQVPLPNLIQWLHAQCRRKFYVPMHETEVAGIRVPLDLLQNARGSWRLGMKYKCLAVNNYKVTLSDEESLIVQARKSRFGERKYNPKSKYLAKAWYNAEGHLLAAIASKLRDGSFFVREFRRRTITRVRHSSCWDYVGPELSERGLGGDLLVATCVNFGNLTL